MSFWLQIVIYSFAIKININIHEAINIITLLNLWKYKAANISHSFHSLSVC